GKSSLLNRLAGRRIAIVDPTSGVTRDRVTAEIRVGDRSVELVDTGGIGIVDSLRLEAQIERQIELAVAAADLIVFLVDARDGLTPLDREVARRLRRVRVPVIVVVNKVDSDRLEAAGAGEFHALGFGEPLLASATHGRGMTALLAALAARLPAPPREDAAPAAADGIRLALVGRTNVGKSSLLNRLARAERVIVSEVPGTTRDAVDVRFELGGHRYVAIDTAGMRRRGALATAVDYYGQVRAERSVRRADVVLLLIDAAVSISVVDKNLGAAVREQVKPCVLVVNKWDLAAEAGATPPAYERYLRAELAGLEFAPIALVSARTGFNVAGLLDLARSLHGQAGIRVATADLNRVLEAARERQQPHRRGRRAPRLFYGTQVGVHPPTFVLFVNDPGLFDERYARYFENRLRAAFPFAEVPLKVEFRARSARADRRAQA
ncbi:MAG: ribosome biogenesis GTPase Der, partial [Planctomycetes bacterium]|nr:ribosome biogenesis GTPase Der [Planctomycetota bacterium]